MKKKFNFLWKGLLMLTCCLFVASVSFAQQWGRWCYKDYPSDGTFTVPAGCTKVWFEAVGGGGAGGFVKGHDAVFPGTYDGVTYSQLYQVSGGGGGGAYSRTDINSGLTPGENFSIKVGVGGRNTADRVTGNDYWNDLGCGTLGLGHCNYTGGIIGISIIFYPDVDWNNLSNSEIYTYPFFKNKYTSNNMRHGGDSYVTRNGSTILLAKGGKTCWGINQHNGGAGGSAAEGIGDIKKSGGKGGNASDRCNGNLGASSSGGGGGAGNPDNVDNTGGNAECKNLFDGSWNTSFGVGGASSGIGGAGGNGTSDWAADFESESRPREGHPGEFYGGGGGGSKTGTLNWSRGGNGAPGFVRVHFYIDDRAITVTPVPEKSTIIGSGSTKITANVSNNLTGSGFYSTSYNWTDGLTGNPITTPTLTGDKQYCVTVTNKCEYATDKDACVATTSACTTITVVPVDPGEIEANNANWVCTPGDTVVTITSKTDPTPATGGKYSWQISSDNSSWSNIPDAPNNKEYTATATGYYRRGYTYNSYPTQYTPSVHVTHPGNIDPGMVKDAGGESTTNVCSGGNVSVNLVANTTYPNITWQKSTDGNNWTPAGSVTPFAINGITTTTYVRYVVNYTSTCEVPSNNHYTFNVWENPVVNSIAEPTDKCPGKTSYEVTADVTAGSNSTLTYHWKGATGSGNVGTVAATLPNCNTTYYDTLYVTDGNNCISNTKTNTFTTENPTWSLGTISSVTAVSDGSCNFSVPALTTLTDTVNSALNSTCGNAATLSGLSLAVGDPITATTTMTVTATDMCGVAHTGVEITVVKPDAPTVTVVPPSVDDYVLCPGETTTLSVFANAEEPAYEWTPSTLGTEATATSIAYTAEDIYVHTDHYSVKVTDKYGCEVTGEIDIYTTPKAYIAAKEYTICSDNAATMSLVSDDKVPTGSATSTPLTFNYNTTYTWTITTPNTNITGAAEAATAQANFTTGNLYNATLEMQTIVYTVTPTTTTTITIEGTVLTNTCDGDPFTVTVNVKPKVTNTGAIDPFDDDDVIITLWYGACDTLYYVNTPTYTNNILPADLLINLTNDKGNTVNEGTLLGRIAPGEYTIIWTVTDECGNHVDFPKKYIVRYPNCGDADPNYTEPYYAVDADNNVYHTVRIGCECWTASNLKTVTGAANSMVYKCNEYPNETENEEKYGRLYTWYTAVNVPEGDNTTEPTVSTAAYSTYPYVHGICPTGWAIPSTENFTSMVGIAGGVNAVKSSSNLYWLPGAEGNDASGFGARGAGYYDSSAERFMNLMGETYFWTYETSSSYGGKCAVISYYCPELLIQDKLKGMGYSIRCIRRENP